MTEFDTGEPAARSAALACNLNGINAADRPRYDELVKRLRAAMQKPIEALNGYGFRLAFTR
jgi:hypothetical protein